MLVFSSRFITSTCLALATAPTRAVVRVGVVYELRASADVLFRASGGNGSLSDLRVRPDCPLVFRSDAEEIFLLAATGADAFAWLRECVEC